MVQKGLIETIHLNPDEMCRIILFFWFVCMYFDIKMMWQKYRNNVVQFIKYSTDYNISFNM